MKVRELIEALSKFPEDMDVMISDIAEGGIWDMSEIAECEVLLNANTSDEYTGPHRTLYTSEIQAGIKGVKVVVI